MILDQRPSDVALVDSIWQAGSTASGSFMSGAATYCELVVTDRGDDPPVVTLRGPATRTTPLTYAGGSAWWGVRFRMGARFPHLPSPGLVDRAVSLPVSPDREIALHDQRVPLPDVDNAEVIVHRLVEAGLLVSDPVIEASWQGAPVAVSQRSLQRRFQHVTGLSQRTARQINRARVAIGLLQEGTSILDTVSERGYCDQAHLTRSLRRWTGLTPAQIIRQPQSILMA